jgi:hypothetical protein
MQPWYGLKPNQTFLAVNAVRSRRAEVSRKVIGVELLEADHRPTRKME